jgi:1,4-dihydroxy-2-naphthoate octaprenyltransferase
VLIPGFGYFVTSGQITRDGTIFILPLMLYGLAFILAVEIPDMESDRLGNKRTWIARKGRFFGFALIATSLFFATSFFFCFPWLATRSYPLDFRFLGILSLLPLSAGCIGLLRRPRNKQSATRIVKGILIALILYCIFVDGYLIFMDIRNML